MPRPVIRPARSRALPGCLRYYDARTLPTTVSSFLLLVSCLPSYHSVFASKRCRILRRFSKSGVPLNLTVTQNEVQRCFESQVSRICKVRSGEVITSQISQSTGSFGVQVNASPFTKETFLFRMRRSSSGLRSIPVVLRPRSVITCVQPPGHAPRSTHVWPRVGLRPKTSIASRSFLKAREGGFLSSEISTYPARCWLMFVRRARWTSGVVILMKFIWGPATTT